MSTDPGTPRVIAGRYSLDSQIGRGGMGVVWRGEDRMLGRTVALKRIGLVPGGSELDLVRAEREARLAARLNHPHIVAIFDLVADGESQWLVMEYVQGRTLAQWVTAEGRLDPEDVRRTLAQAADALAAAHGAEILHRDVKPSNILIRHDGGVKLTDFGIARAAADATLTRTGHVTGSPAYLAPEVASGGRASAASDVWSLGATLYHAVEGRPPYDMSDNVLSGLYQIVHGPEPRSQRAGPLGLLLEHTLVKDPEQRWSMAEVRDALSDPELLRAGAAAGSRRSGPRTRTRTTPVAPPPSRIAPTPGTGSRGREPRPPRQRRRPRRGVLLGVLGVLLLLGAVTGLALSLANRDATPEGAATPDSAETTPGDGESSPTEEAQRQSPRAFIREYLSLATTDPSASWEMLTPAFQERSGGFESYSGFWGGIAAASPSALSYDAATGQVSYDVAYQLADGGTRSDSVTLQLVETDGSYRIAGEF